MSVAFEANIKRRHHRVTVPLFLRIGDATHKAADWSVGGFQITDYTGDLQPGAEFAVTVLLPYSEFSIHLPLRARVARHENKELGCAFLDLTPAQHGALHHLVEAALEGRMGDLGEALTALRDPVVGAEKKLIEETEASALAVARMRLVPKVVLYVGTVLAIMALICGTIYYLTSRVRIPDGVIVGNLMSVAAQAPGRLARLAVAEGQKVNAGDVLFEIESPAAKTDFTAAQTKVATVLAEMQAAQMAVDGEKARVQFYAGIAPLQFARAESSIKRIEARLRAAKSDLGRTEELWKSKVGSLDEYERARREHDALLAEREEAATELGVAQLNVRSVADGLFYDGRAIQGRVKELQEQLAVQASRMVEAKQELAAAKQRLDELTIKAPAAGEVYTVLHTSGESVNALTPVVALNLGDGYFVMGNLLADEAVKIKPDQPVKVLIPSLGLQLKGKVIQIGRQASVSANTTPAEMETAGKIVPVKIALADAPPQLTPGLRSVLIMRVSPWLKAFAF